MVVTAKDQGSPRLTSTTTLTIHVLDTNDQAPQFSQSEYRVNILEKSPIDSVILYASATDIDTGENGEIVYSLSGRAGVDQYFSVDETTGLVRIAQPVDKTTLTQMGLLSGTNNSVVEMLLTATDGGEPSLLGEASLFVNIDEINDDTPQFNNVSYFADVLEEEVLGKLY